MSNKNVKRLVLSLFALLIVLTGTSLFLPSNLQKTQASSLLQEIWHTQPEYQGTLGVSDLFVGNGKVYKYVNKDANSEAIDGYDETNGTALYHRDLFGNDGLLYKDRFYVPVYSGGTDIIQVFDANNNQSPMLWSALGFRFTIVNDILYSIGDNGMIYAYNTTTEAQLWSRQAYCDGNVGPVEEQGLVYFAGCNNTVGLYALHSSDGSDAWSQPLNACWLSPVVVGNILYQKLCNGSTQSIAALDATTGSLLWTKSFPNGSQITTVVAGTNAVYVNTWNGVNINNPAQADLYALSSNNTVLWHNTFANVQGVFPLTFANGIVYYGASFQLYALDAASGSQIDSISFAQGFEPWRIISADSKLFLLVFDTNTYSFNVYAYNLVQETASPTGKWLSPTSTFTINQGKSIKLSIQADPSQGGALVDHVNVNAWWKGVDPKNWINIHTMTTPDSSTTDHYTFEWNFKANGNYIPESPVEFSFDVVDKSGNIAYRPGGVRSGIFVNTTPPSPPSGAYVTMSVSVDQITCIDTLTFSVHNAAADEIRISGNGTFLTKLPGGATTYVTAPQNVTNTLFEVTAFSQTHFLALARFFATAPACGQGTPPKAPISPMPDSQNDIFVLVQGMNSCLQDNCNNNIPEGNNGYGYSPGFEQDYTHIAGSLMWNGYLNSRFIVYSYTGSYYDGMPNSYACQDTWQNTLQDDALQLGKQIASAVNGNKNIRVHLIGHSLGGAVIATYIASQLYGLYSVPGLPDMHQLVDVNILDGALGGVTSNSNFLPWIEITQPFKCSGVSSYTSANQLATQFASATDPKHVGQTASAFPLFLGSTTFVSNQQIVDEAHNLWGTTFDVIGNLRDNLWRIKDCTGIPNFLSTEYVKDEGSGVYSRVFSSGSANCLASSLNSFNHNDVLSNNNVNRWVFQIVSHVPVPSGLSPYSG